MIKTLLKPTKIGLINAAHVSGGDRGAQTAGRTQDGPTFASMRDLSDRGKAQVTLGRPDRDNRPA